MLRQLTAYPAQKWAAFTPVLHLKAIGICLSLYLIATWCSMAGMEIFGWTTFALTMGYAYRTAHSSELRLRELVTSQLPWKTMIALYAIVLLGIFYPGTPDGEKLAMLGSHRWMFLLIGHSFALALFPPTLKGYRLFLIFTSVIAVYAVVQSFTGFDLLRFNGPNPHRAVQPLDVRKEISLWRSAGLFGSPMGYVYIAGFHSCLALAVALVFPKSARRLRLWSILAFSLIAASLVTTYVRGAWISITIAVLAMTWLASRRFFIWAVGAGAMAFATLFVGLIQFRERFLSLFDAKYSSNTDRWNLIKTNWRMFLDHPVLGIGWEMNEVRSCEYVDCLAIPRPFTGHAHNNYMQALAGLGLTGFAAYMTFIGFFMWLTYRLWKRLPQDLYWARALVLAAFGAQIHLHVGGLTECNFKAGATNHNFMVILGLVASLSYLEKKGLLRTKYDALAMRFENHAI